MLRAGCSFAQAAAETGAGVVPESWLEPLLKSVSIYLASGVEGFAALIEMAAGLVLVGSCTVAFCSAAMLRTTARARELVADGALTALNVIVCATCSRR